MQAKITRGLISADRTRVGKRIGRQTPKPESNDATTRNPTGMFSRLSKLIVPNRITAYAMAAMVVAFGFFFVARLSVRGEIYPGIHAANVPLGGLSGAEARDRLSEQAESFAAQQVTLTYGDLSWSPTLAELGISLNIDGAVYQAMSFGRDDHVITSLLRPLRIGDSTINVPVAIHVDQSRYDQALLDYALEAGIAPRDARIDFVDGSPAIETERNGQVFDGAAVEAELLRHLGSTPSDDDTGQPIASIGLVAHDQPATIRATDLDAIKSSLDQALSKPMTFEGAGQKWSLAPDELARLIDIRPADGDTPITFALNDASLRSIADRLADEIDRQPVDASIEEGDKVARLAKPQPGRTVRVDDFVAAINQAFVAGEHTVAIPIDETAPGKSTDALLTELGVTELLGIGTSDFAGSEAGRVQNVEVSAKLVDGVMIAPGGEFRFNYSIGEINATPGFVPAGASENGISGTAVGGGVCQVTTTIFRAALKAGMPITEWWPHAYRNIYYEQGGWAPGFDASIQQPDDDPFNGSDFAFKNSTDHWMLLRSKITDDTILTIELYGAPTGYTVQIDDPIYENYLWAEGMAAQESVDTSLPAGTIRELQPARDGVTMTVVRRVYAADGTEVSTDTFVSQYEPQGPSYVVSPDMAGSNQDGL